jgi:hypothetical protein
MFKLTFDFWRNFFMFHDASVGRWQKFCHGVFTPYSFVSGADTVLATGGKPKDATESSSKVSQSHI